MLVSVDADLGFSRARWELIEPFIQSTQSAFLSALQWKVTLLSVNESKDHEFRYHCNGVVGLSGALSGAVVLSMDKDATMAAAETYTGVWPSLLSKSVMYLVGELTMAITRSGVDALGETSAILGTPSVIAGSQLTYWFRANIPVEVLRFSSPRGPFSVEVGIRRNRKPSVPAAR